MLSSSVVIIAFKWQASKKLQQLHLMIFSRLQSFFFSSKNSIFSKWQQQTHTRTCIQTYVYQWKRMSVYMFICWLQKSSNTSSKCHHASAAASTVAIFIHTYVRTSIAVPAYVLYVWHCNALQMMMRKKLSRKLNKWERNVVHYLCIKITSHLFIAANAIPKRRINIHRAQYKRTCIRTNIRVLAYVWNVFKKTTNYNSNNKIKWQVQNYTNIK